MEDNKEVTLYYDNITIKVLKDDDIDIIGFGTNIKDINQIDIYINLICDKLDIDTLMDIVMLIPLKRARTCIIECLSKEIYKYGKHTYIWNQLSEKTEYTYYQFRKRRWPVKNQNNLTWQQLAVKIGMAKQVYPGIKHDDENKTENKTENTILDIPEHEEEFQNDIDNNRLINMLDDRTKQIRREQVQTILKAESNYAVYGLPVIEPDEHMFKHMVRLSDVLIKLERNDLFADLVCRLFISQDHYHFAIKNPSFMNRVGNLLEKNNRFSGVIRYYMRYCIYLLLKEERLVGTKIRENNRSVFDEDQYRSLPIFQADLDEQPYFAEVCRNDNDKGMQNKILMHVKGERRFTTRDEFINRLSLMNSGLLDDIDLSEYDAFLTGSSLVPCNVVTPLESKFINTNNPFMNYCESYYPSYTSISTYLDDYNKSRLSLIQYVESLNICQQKIDELKQLYRNEFLTTVESIIEDISEPGFIERKHTYVSSMKSLDSMESKLADLDIAITSLSMRDYERKVFAMFKIIKENTLKRTPDAELYLVKKETKFSYKWVMYGYGRPIDFFKINVKAHALVFTFHLNIVRFWWDGRKVYGLASGVCAALTGLNQWYRWFSNNKDPIDIVLKNMQRSFTTLLSECEIQALMLYIKEVPKYKHCVKTLQKGRAHINHNLFGHEGGIRYGFPKNVIEDTNNTNIMQYWPLINTYNRRVMCDLSFSSEGKILPPKIYALQSLINDLLDVL